MRAFNISLAFLGLIAILGILSGSDVSNVDFIRGTKAEEFFYSLHTGNEIIFTLSSSLLASLFLWFIVVKMPESRKRKILRNNLAKQYQHFREDTIGILLSASGNSYDSKLQRRLCDYREFKQYFGENNNAKRYDALNGMQEDKDYLNDLMIQIELLANEMNYVLNNVDIDDDRIHSFFRNMCKRAHELKNLSRYTEDRVKSLGNFIYGILAQWSFIDGQRKEDIVQKMIEKI